MMLMKYFLHNEKACDITLGKRTQVTNLNLEYQLHANMHRKKLEMDKPKWYEYLPLVDGTISHLSLCFFVFFYIFQILYNPFILLLLPERKKTNKKDSYEIRELN